MDIIEKAKEFAEKIKGDKSLLKKFQDNPAGTVENLLSVSLPGAQIDTMVDVIKAQLSLGKGKGLLGKASGLFKK